MITTWNIPDLFTQGDRVTWIETFSGYNPSTDTLSCFLRGLDKALDLTGVPLLTDAGWEFTITETQSATFNPGKYKAQFIFFGTRGRATLGSADLVVLPSFEGLATLETRTDDEIELEQITVAIARLASGAVAEYRIGDRMMRYQDLAALTQRQQYLRNRIAKAKNPKNIGGRNVGVRFSND